MRNMMLCLLAAIFLLLCGCTDSEISCGIDVENRAFLRYDLNLDLEMMSLSERMTVVDGLHLLADSLKEKGFTVEHNAISAANESFYLRAELLQQGENQEQALVLLRKILTDENVTPFTAVVCESQSQQMQNACRVSLRLEPDRVLATTELEHYPNRLKQRVQDALKTGNLRLTLHMPATELPEGETARLDNGIASKTMNLSLTEHGELSLFTLQSVGNVDSPELWWGGKSRKADSATALERQIRADAARLKTGELICEGAVIVFAGLAVLLFFWGTRRRKLEYHAATEPNDKTEVLR
ncbi:MAG: hypothetical protein IIY70_05830 [Oscillospiraceae bacterium]|nr:hypothetical protein [Oscillospiraceae bacterium]